ncbi:MAG: tetratricopeptide repeat protein [Alistipes sp.]|nr:tetratricopeptide repeat protein [Alistipes sp.]MBR7096638.1 tetratricopeptide repeat protein [Alistipes sp.]
MQRIKIVPSASGEYQIAAPDFIGFKQSMLKIKDWAQVAEKRFEMVQQFLDSIEDEELPLDWEHSNTRAAIETIYASAIDSLSIGEVEIAAALWENLMSMDQEDHMSVSVPLAFCYVVLEDFDCFESVMFDISTKRPEYHLLTLWQEYFRSKGLDIDALRELRTRHKAWFAEFIADSHPVDDAYLADSRKDKPTPTTEARELWFVLEPLMETYPEFIEILRKA